jgi:hypothetical protein
MPEEKQDAGVIDSELLFTQLVLSFQAAAWQQMGKVPSMVSGKIERSLEMAKFSIDMLGMLEEKTKGNLNDEELKFLRHILFELRMNFLEEQKTGSEPPETAPEQDSKEKPNE